MSIKHEVRDGYFSDLPSPLQADLIAAHRRMNDEIDVMWYEDAYKAIRGCDHCRNMLGIFRGPLENTGDVGQVRVSKVGEKYEAMIQFTGHFTNHQNAENEILLHKFVDAVFKKLKPILKKEFSLELDSEGSDGNFYEGFDVYPSGEVAKEIWELFDDKTTKTYKEHQAVITQNIVDYYELYRRLPFDKFIEGRMSGEFNESAGEDVYRRRLEMWMENSKRKIGDDDDNFFEASEMVMPPNAKEAKKTLAALTTSVQNDRKKNKPVTQYTGKLYADIITKTLLHTWAPGWQSLKISITDYQTFNTVEFKVPKMTEDFISRFIEGRETISGFLHRNPEIHMKISPRIFDSINSPDDAYNFFKAAVRYYDSSIEKFGTQLMAEVRKLGPEMKKLIGSSKLMGIVTYPLSLLFVFDDVQISNPGVFKVSKEDIKAVNDFVKNIGTAYKDPEKEKGQIVKDVQAMVKALHEAVGMNDDNRHLYYLPESLNTLLSGGFDNDLEDARYEFEQAQINREWTRNPPTDEIRYLQEKFGVKKLKKIPRDIVAYITIEAEAIKDANDKMMIASYCLGKLEIVEWYIELLDVGSKKYVVPHDKPYLQSMRTQLLACYKKIMDTPIPKQTTRPIIDIQYPAGFEG